MISVQYSFVEYDCTTPRQCTVDARRVQDELQEGAGEGRFAGIRPAFDISRPQKECHSGIN